MKLLPLSFPQAIVVVALLAMAFAAKKFLGDAAGDVPWILSTIVAAITNNNAAPPPPPAPVTQ